MIQAPPFLASVRMLKQFEKDGIKWEKLAKEIAQK
jgi:hypothetical protein